MVREIGMGMMLIAGMTGSSLNAQQECAPELIGKYKWIDFRYYPSSVTPGIRLAATFRKPRKPGPILVTAHGWHGSLVMPTERDDHPGEYLTISVDMRGRKYSTGKPDASGWELQDWIDAVEFAKKEYREYISDPGCVYALGESGSGGNTYALLGKYPDYLTAAVVRVGMSDYTRWYREDEKGEFRDELEPWIGGTPETNAEGYRSRSGITTVSNILTPLLIIHAEKDIRVPCDHARVYYQAAKRLGKKVEYVELVGAGGKSHYENITDQQKRLRSEKQREFLARYVRPPVLRGSGSMVVAGYLKTKKFEIVLASIDRMGEVSYDLRPDMGEWTFALRSDTSKTAVLRVRLPGLNLDALEVVSDPPEALTSSPQFHGEWLNIELVVDRVTRTSIKRKG